MSDTATAPDATSAGTSTPEHPHQAVIDGLRNLAQWLESHPDVPGPLGARAGRHMGADEYLDTLARLEGERPGERKTTTNAYDTYAIHFGPVEYVMQTDADGLRQHENLQAFWEACRRLGTLSSADVRDMAPRYALTDEQTTEAIAQVADR